MWIDVASLAATFVTAAAGANWLTRRSTRRLRDLRAHAEVYALLPAGPARDTIASIINEVVEIHARERRNARLRTWRQWTMAIVLAAMAITLAGLAVTTARPFGEDEPMWVSFARWAALALGVGGVYLARWMDRVGDRQGKQTLDPPTAAPEPRGA